MKDELSLIGVYTAYCLDPITHQVTRTYQSENLITRAGKNLVARLLLDVAAYDMGLTYQALGEGTVVARERDTQLVIERARRAITTRTDTTSTSAAFFTYFPATEVPATIQEVGIFGHNATEVANSGVLFSRSLLNVPDADQEDLTISYVLSVG